MTTQHLPMTHYNRTRNVLFGVGVGLGLVGLIGLYFTEKIGYNTATIAFATLASAGFGFGLAGLMMSFVRFMPYWVRERAEDQAADPAYKIYMRTMWRTMAIYIVLLGIGGVANLYPMPVALRAVLAVAPVVPLGWLLFAHLRYLRGIDEMQRRIELESIGIAAMVTAIAYMAAGFLQSAKVIHIDGALAMLLMFPMLCVTYGIGKFFVARHYR